MCQSKVINVNTCNNFVGSVGCQAEILYQMTFLSRLSWAWTPSENDGLVTPSGLQTKKLKNTKLKSINVFLQAFDGKLAELRHKCEAAFRRAYILWTFEPLSPSKRPTNEAGWWSAYSSFQRKYEPNLIHNAGVTETGHCTHSYTANLWYLRHDRIQMGWPENKNPQKRKLFIQSNNRIR